MQENTLKISLGGGEKRTPKTKGSKNDIKKHHSHLIKGPMRKEGLTIYDRIRALLDIEIDTSLKY